MNSRIMLIFAAGSGFLFTALGALSSHMLDGALSSDDRHKINIGLEYQRIHTLAILFLAAIMQWRDSIWFRWSGFFLTAGILLFSGSLYGFALSHQKFLAYLTPTGGLCLLVGWMLMMAGAFYLKKEKM